MSAKKTSGAVMTSLIVHGIAFIIGGIYLVTQTQQFKTFIGAEVLQAKEPPKPQVRKPVFKQSSQRFQLQIQWLSSRFRFNTESRQQWQCVRPPYSHKPFWNFPTKC